MNKTYIVALLSALIISGNSFGMETRSYKRKSPANPNSGQPAKKQKLEKLEENQATLLHATYCLRRSPRLQTKKMAPIIEVTIKDTSSDEDSKENYIDVITVKQEKEINVLTNKNILTQAQTASIFTNAADFRYWSGMFKASDETNKVLKEYNIDFNKPRKGLSKAIVEYYSR